MRLSERQYLASDKRQDMHIARCCHYLALSKDKARYCLTDSRSGTFNPGLCPGLRTLRLVQPYRLVTACDRLAPGYPQRSVRSGISLEGCTQLATPLWRDIRSGNAVPSYQREAQQGTVLQTVLPIRLTPGLCPGLRTLRLVQPYRLVTACDGLY